MEVHTGVNCFEKFNLASSILGEANLESFDNSDVARVQSAFEELRNKLPYNEQENLTELEVLQLAAEYIYVLQQILLEKENQSPKLNA